MEEISQIHLNIYIYRFKKLSNSQVGQIHRTLHLNGVMVKLLKTKDKDKYSKHIQKNYILHTKE